MHSIVISVVVCRAFLDNRPNVKRRCDGKNQAREQNRRSRELKLAVLSVVKISRTDFDEKEDCQNHIQHGKDNIVYHVLNL